MPAAYRRYGRTTPDAIGGCVNPILFRSFVASLIFTVLLGSVLGVSCLPEHVTCSVVESPAKTLASEVLIAFGLALFVPVVEMLKAIAE